MRRGAGGAYFDLLAAHPYGFGRPPDDPPAADRLSFRRLEPYRAVMEAHGDGNKAVWITEMGWRNQAVAPEDAWQAVSPEQQAEYVARALACVADELPWLERMALWELNAGVDVYGYALWQGPGQATPACDDLVERCRGQVGCPVPVARKSDPSAEVEILAADVIIRLGDISTLHPQWVHLPSLPGAVDDASGSRDQFVARIYVGQGGELVVGHLNRLWGWNGAARWEPFGPADVQGALYGVAGCCRSGAEVTTHLPGIWRHDGGGWARSDGGYFDDVRVTDALRIGNSVYGLRCVGHGLWPDGRLYVARTGGVAWSDDATAEPVVWHESAGLESVTFFRAAPNPVQTALVWTGTWGNDIGVSSDGGATLTSLRNGLETLSILDILWHATPGQVTVATIEGLYRSDDGGQSWFKLPGPLALQPVYALHQADGGTLLAGAADGLWLSQDDGATWQHVPELADHPAMRLGRADSPQAPKRRLSHLPAPAHVGII